MTGTEKMVELLRVTDTFLIKGRGLVLMPDFGHIAGKRASHSFPAQVVPPDNPAILTNAIVDVAHFNITDASAPLERRWRAFVVLPELGKEKVPIGSALFVPAEIHDALSAYRR